MTARFVRRIIATDCGRQQDRAVSLTRTVTPRCGLALHADRIAGDSDKEEPLAEPETGVKRVLQIKLRALGEPAQILALIRSASPFYRTLGGAGFRVLQNVDDPAQLVVEIEYEAHAALELNRHKVASDAMVRTFLQGWRTMLAGNAGMDVYEDVTE
jgi:hypothetical protein